MVATIMQDNMQSLTKGLRAVATVTKVASFAMPFAALALDLFVGSQPNPEYEAIKT
jgi:hypothetical protein